MPFWLLLVLSAIGGFAAYQFYRGVRLGSVWTRYSYTDRFKDPVFFWIFLVLYGVGALFLLLLTVVLVALRGVALGS